MVDATALGRLPGREERHSGLRGNGPAGAEARGHGAQPPPAHDQPSSPGIGGKTKTVEDTRDHRKPGEVCSAADELTISWLPTLCALWSPRGQPVMIPTPEQPDKRDGLGAVNDPTGETVVLFRRRKRRREAAEWWQALVDKPPTGTIDVAWDHAETHADDAVEAIVRAAAGRLVRLDLPTDSPWLNPLEMLGRQFRREVTHGARVTSLDALMKAAHAVFDRDNQSTARV
jgi:hypothetical protein